MVGLYLVGYAANPQQEVPRSDGCLQGGWGVPKVMITLELHSLSTPLSTLGSHSFTSFFSYTYADNLSFSYFHTHGYRTI